MTTAHINRVYIRADLDAAWQAICDPAFTRQYFFGSAFAAPPVAGEPFASVLPDGSVAVDGVVEEVDPPHRLVHTWHVRYDPALEAEPPSRVTWTLTQAGPGLVLVEVVHSDLAFSPLTWANVRDGWVYVLDGLKSVLETGAPLPPRDAPAAAPDAPGPAKDWHRAQAVEANNATWTHLGADPVDAEALLRGAYTAAYHWERAAGATAANEVRALYLIGKAWLAVGNPALGLDYAERCLEDARAAGLDDFDLTYALELRARALHASGRADEARADWAAALAVPIADAEDRAIVESDLATPPWG